MGLAPYGEPKYKDIIINELLDLKEDGSFRLNMKYFNFATGLTMTNQKFSKLFGQKVRNPNNELLTQFHMDIASSIQAATEEIVIRLTSSISKETFRFFGVIFLFIPFLKYFLFIFLTNSIFA